MYIPVTYFGTQGSCITATTSTITGSGTITSGSFISGGYYWDYWKFETTDYTDSGYPAYTASFNILTGSSVQAKLLIVGGGGVAGGRQQTFNTASQNYTTTYSGGGGGGGIVYYDQFPLASGSYEIGVAGASAGTSAAFGYNGRDSYIKLPNNRIYTPFTDSYLLAQGGGGGGTIGYYTLGGQNYYYSVRFNGGSGGGAGSALDGTAQGVGGLPNPNGGLSQAQGFRGGTSAGPNSSTGGGGAGAIGVDSDGSIAVLTNGGIGALYNVTGTPTYYAGGGGGATKGPGSGSYGQGSTAANSIGGTSTVAKGGVVIIAIPKCLSAFDCTNFNITGSNGTLSYLPCGYPFVTQSVLSSVSHRFSACLTTFAGTDTPVLLTGTTTSSAAGDCSAQFTSSNDCHCTGILAVPNSGTQTITLFPCNGSGSVTQSVPPTGKNFCIERYSSPSFPSGSVLTYGLCNTGSCGGITYTSSFVTCSSILATAGSGGGTLTYVPCGSGSAIQFELSGSESRSICAAYTSSFLSLTGIGSTLSTLGTCSVVIPNLISWSFTETDANGTFRIYNNSTLLDTLTSNGSGNTAITASTYITASITPSNSSSTMTINVNGPTTLSVSSSNSSNPLTASFLSNGNYSINASITADINCRYQMISVFNTGTWTYYKCDGTFVTESYNNRYTSSIATCTSQSVSLIGAGNQLFTSPYNCSFVWTGSTTTQTITFGTQNEQPYTMISYVPKGSTTYVFQILSGSNTFGPVCTLSGSAYMAEGSGNPFERKNIITGSLNC